MTSNFINYFRIKHIDVTYYFVKNKVKERTVKLKYILIDQMIVDKLIKSLKFSKFRIFKTLMKLVSSEFKEMKESSE